MSNKLMVTLIASVALTPTMAMSAHNLIYRSEPPKDMTRPLTKDAKPQTLEVLVREVLGEDWKIFAAEGSKLDALVTAQSGPADVVLETALVEAKQSAVLDFKRKTVRISGEKDITERIESGEIRTIAIPDRKVSQPTNDQYKSEAKRTNSEAGIAAASTTVPSFVLEPGQPIHIQLASWAIQEGWVLNWNVEATWLVSTRYTFTGSFETALKSALNAIAAQGKPMKVVIWPNKVADISLNDGGAGTAWQEMQTPKIAGHEINMHAGAAPHPVTTLGSSGVANSIQVSMVGRGGRTSLREAITTIVPSDQWRIYVQSDVDLNAEVTWQGGIPWTNALKSVSSIANAESRVDVVSKNVFLVSLRNKMDAKGLVQMREISTANSGR